MIATSASCASAAVLLNIVCSSVEKKISVQARILTWRNPLRPIVRMLFQQLRGFLCVEARKTTDTRTWTRREIEVRKTIEARTWARGKIEVRKTIETRTCARKKIETRKTIEVKKTIEARKVANGNGTIDRNNF